MATLAEFVRQLEDCEIVEPQTLKGVLASDESLRTAGDLARELVKQKQLTKFQAQRIYEGKAKSLVLGNYTILEEIGAGGMGRVYKARHRHMDRIVAVKMLPPDVARDSTVQSRFQREVVAAAKLGHPHIVAAYDADLVGDPPFLVMEFVDGIDLAALVRRSGPLPLIKAIGCILQAARGLEYAHKQGIVHRDIKPANLLVDKAGKVKILDMGLARMEAGSQALVETQSELTSAGSFVGTVDYMAPEQALGGKIVDPRSDIYSLGCTLYFLLSGKALYGGDSIIGKLLAHREKPIPSLIEVQPQVPAALEEAFLRIVAKNPDDRFQTIGELIPVLQNLGKTLSGRLAPPPVLDEQQAAAPGGGDSILDDIGIGYLEFGSSVIGKSKIGKSKIGKSKVGGSGIGKKGSDESGSAAETPPTEPAAQPPSKLTGSWPPRKIGIAAAAIGLPLLVGAAILFHALTGESTNGDSKPGKSADETIALASGNGDSASGANGSPQGADFDRQAAELLRKHRNYTLKVAIGNQLPREIGAGAVLPDSRFKVVEAAIVGEPISEDDFARLARLTDLSTLWLEGANVTDAMLAKLPQMRKLESLGLAGNPAIDDDGMKQIARQTGVHWLDVSATSVTPEGLKSLQPLANLNRLDLNTLKIDSQWLRPLSSLASLKCLEIKDTPLGDNDLAGLQGQRLTMLDLDRTQLTDSGLQKLSGLLPGLRHLSIQKTSVTAAAVAAFRQELPDCLVDWTPSDGSDTAIAVNPSPSQPPAADPDRAAAAWVFTVQATAKLMISEAGGPPKLQPAGAPLPTAPFKIVEIAFADASLPNVNFSRLSGLNELQRLAVQRCDLSDAVLATLPPLAKLESLDLAGNRRVTDASLKSLGDRTGLRNLNLSDTGVNSAGLALLKPLVNLESLSLNGIADINGKSLAQLAPLTKLQRLEVSSTRIGDADLAQLNLPSAKSLNLSRCKLTDAGLKRLSESLPRLEWIDVSGAAVTLAGIADFEKAAPRCIIEWTPPAR